MKNLLITTLFIFFTQFGYAQLVLTPESDTIFWYSWKNENASRFSLGMIETEISDFSFRFWSYGFLLAVTQNDDRYFGEISHFVEEYPPKENNQVFQKRYEISAINTKLLIGLIDSFNIKDLPTDKNIDGWKKGFDGIEYLIEYRQGNKYTFKNYWTPTANGNLKEAKELLGFISSVNSLLALDNGFKTFDAEIPFNGWTFPGSGAAAIRFEHKSTKKKSGS